MLGRLYENIKSSHKNSIPKHVSRKDSETSKYVYGLRHTHTHAHISN